MLPAEGNNEFHNHSNEKIEKIKLLLYLRSEDENNNDLRFHIYMYIREIRNT